jgi:hypothetical protein
MNNVTKFLIIAAILLVGVIIWSMATDREEVVDDPVNGTDVPQEVVDENDDVEEEMTQAEREEMVSQYIQENISELSPEPEVLGGTFYVNDITFTGDNSGIVEYEDGHIMLVANFTYTFNAEGEPEVTFTEVNEG